PSSTSVSIRRMILADEVVGTEDVARKCRASQSGPDIREFVRDYWLGGRDSNPDTVVQSHVSYRWTTSQYLSGSPAQTETLIIEVPVSHRQLRTRQRTGMLGSVVRLVAIRPVAQHVHADVASRLDVTGPIRHRLVRHRLRRLRLRLRLLLLLAAMA